MEFNPHAQDNLNTVSLSTISPSDSIWDDQRARVDAVSSIYRGSFEFEKYAQRMGDCSGRLIFGWQDNQQTGECKLKLKEAQFCRVRHCPICQWRRSLMWQARFYQAIPSVIQGHPKARWIFLTLTARNCEIVELRNQIQLLNESWQRLIKRKEFAFVQGWIRATEVTRGKDGSAHPHFHCLLMVPPSMFAKNYVTQARWAELWKSCGRFAYDPIIDVRVVKPKKGSVSNGDSLGDELRGAIAETLKYSVKPSDMTDDPQWFLELTSQAHKLRFIATGGALKGVLRQDDDSEMICVESDQQEIKNLISFDWRSDSKKYQKAKDS